MTPDEIKQFIEANYPSMISKRRRNPDGWAFYYKQVRGGTRSTRIARAVRSSPGAPTYIKLAVSAKLNPRSKATITIDGGPNQVRELIDGELRLYESALESGTQLVRVRRPFTEGEVILCSYAAQYDLGEIGGIEAITSLTRRSEASVKLKIENIAAMMDEKGIPRNSTIRPLSGLPKGESGRQTNWELVAQLVTIPRGDLLNKCKRVLERLYALPGEIGPEHNLVEGAVRTVVVDSYERSPEARKLCIEHYGARCFVCGFDFEKRYGKIAAGFIHVHHLKPLSEIGAQYEVDPVKDLLPLCPNCHAVVHMRNPPYEPDELKGLIKRTSGEA